MGSSRQLTGMPRAAEIKADEDGKAEYENVIRRLEARKRDLEKRIGGDAWPGARPRRPPQSQTATAPSPRAVANQDWINTYEKDLGECMRQLGWQTGPSL